MIILWLPASITCDTGLQVDLKGVVPNRLATAELEGAASSLNTTFHGEKSSYHKWSSIRRCEMISPRGRYLHFLKQQQKED